MRPTVQSCVLLLDCKEVSHAIKLNVNLVFTNEKLKQSGIIDKQINNKYDRAFTNKSDQICKPNVSLQSKSNMYFAHFLCFRPQGMTLELLWLDARKILSHAL
jgi:hypothetical protein